MAAFAPPGLAATAASRSLRAVVPEMSNCDVPAGERGEGAEGGERHDRRDARRCAARVRWAGA